MKPSPHPLGVMQGRLLPKYKGRYQAHPKGYWADEFAIASSMGLDLIEFILDYEDAEDNPLLALGGIKKIQEITAKTGVSVRSICADYFMEVPLHRGDKKDEATAVLIRLLENAHVLGVTDIVIPCVDHSRIEDTDQESKLINALARALPTAEALGINLSLETDLNPKRFATLLERTPSRRITVNYDIGNSAALGFNPEDEWAAYGSRVSDVHVKDRVLGGGSVVLGSGNANIPLVFQLMKQNAFVGPVIMQAYRDDSGIAVFNQQLEWLHKCLA